MEPSNFRSYFYAARDIGGREGKEGFKIESYPKGLILD